jgi:hypothetical protein
MMEGHKHIVSTCVQPFANMQELQSGQEPTPSGEEETATDHLILDCPPAEETSPHLTQSPPDI